MSENSLQERSPAPKAGDPPFSAIVEAIQRANSVLILSHISPDGDAIGSLLAMRLIVRYFGKKVVAAIADPVPEVFQFLPDSKCIEQRARGKHDLVIALDASDTKRLGDLYTQHVAGAVVINIDHHVTNLGFGQINWVDPTAAATAELIYLLVVNLGVPLTPELATCLLTGVVTDTRGFRTNNTTPRLLHAASHLFEAGAPLFQIMDTILERRSLAQMRLWARAIDHARLHGVILWCDVTPDDRRAAGVQENGSETGLSSFLLSAQEASISAVFVQRDAFVDVSMRARPGFDVSTTALALGGGGHPLAAGCIIVGTLEEAHAKLFAALDANLAELGHAQPKFTADQPR